jgi:DnaD/phage-associated family protein
MGSKFWIKLYIEMLNDRKVARLSTHLRWRMVECFLLAGMLDKDGELPPVDEAAWLLRLQAEQLQEDWDALWAAGILNADAEALQDEKAPYYVVNFAKRQEPDTVNKRVREYRKRQHRDEYYEDVTQPLRNGNDNVTTRYTPETGKPDDADNKGESTEMGGAGNEPVTTRYEVVTEREREEREKNGGNEPVTTRYEVVTQADKEEVVGSLFSLFEQEIGPLTPHIGNELGDLLDSYPVSWVQEAIHIASENNIRKVSYVNGVLRRWFIEGKDSPGSSSTTPPTLDSELERRGYES